VSATIDDRASHLQAVESSSQREAARTLVSEYLRWVAGIALSSHGLSFDIDAMVRSDIHDAAKFYRRRAASTWSAAQAAGSASAR